MLVEIDAKTLEKMVKQSKKKDKYIAKLEKALKAYKDQVTLIKGLKDERQEV